MEPVDEIINVHMRMRGLTGNYVAVCERDDKASINNNVE